MRLRPARNEECQALSGLALKSKAHWGYHIVVVRSQSDIDAAVMPGYTQGLIAYFVD